MSKPNPFVGKSSKELLGLIAEEHAKLRDMNLKLSIGQLRAVRTVRVAKKNIARMETQLTVIKAS